MRMQDRTVIVTGGAQGIGRGIADRLAREGAKVMIGDLNRDRAEETAAELSEEGLAVEAREADVSDRASTQGLIAGTVERFGRLDVMFNNAGFNKPEPFLDITEDVWHRVMNVNALGVLIGTQEAARA
jgi:meso-butanediol dehydrogenase/(S,S)-butanediol dehydrogenase/diacetyl reductase